MNKEQMGRREDIVYVWYYEIYMYSILLANMRNCYGDQNCSLGLKDYQMINIKSVFRFHYTHMKSLFK